MYLAAPIATYTNDRYERSARQLRRLLPTAEIIEARGQFASTADWKARWPTLLERVDRLVFICELNGATIDLSTFQAIHECLDADIPVFLLTRGSQRLVPREHLRFIFYEKEGSRRFAHVEIHYDSRINHKAWS